jgi:hypothetical protein
MHQKAELGHRHKGRSRKRPRRGRADTPPSRFVTLLLIPLGAFLLLIGMIGVPAAFSHATTTHQGEIVDRGVRVVQVSVHPLVRFREQGVHVEVDGSTHFLDNRSLYDLAGRVTLPIAVTVEEDSIGGLKRIWYDGVWYGVAAPFIVQLMIGVLGFALGLGALWLAVRRMQRRRGLLRGGLGEIVSEKPPRSQMLSSTTREGRA